MSAWLKRCAAIALLLSVLFVPTAVSAEDPLADICAANPSSPSCKSVSPDENPFTGSDGILYKASIVVSVVAGIVAVFMIMFSGFQMIASSGDSQKVSGARKTLVGSVVGLVIIAVAQSVVLFVVGRL